MNWFTRYRSVIRFTVILTVCVAVSLWLARYIPADVFDNIITPILFSCSVAVEFFSLWIILRHTDGLRFRRAWAWTLLIWGVSDAAYIILWVAAPRHVMDMGASQLSTPELLLGNLLGFMLLLYPTEALRPGWLNWKCALWLLPMLALAALDYVIPVNLQPFICLYPVVLTALLLTHVRAYRIWCEENYSTLDDIDVQWIVRYLVMLVLVGLVYMYMCITHSHTRGFTQLWLVIFVLAYSTEQILFRKDPWTMVRHIEKEKHPETAAPIQAELRKKVEDWMKKEKPYLNPGFQLSDMCQELAMSRDDLSKFINDEFGCNFYQFVNGYRIDEAKRLKMNHPEFSVEEVAIRCGFTSGVVFSSIFTRETGLTPREWSKKVLLRK